jgi:hypothetical protein
MRVEVEDLPDWTFEVREVSAGVYNVRAVHLLGPSVDLTDTSPEVLLEKAKDQAKSLQNTLRR